MKKFILFITILIALIIIIADFDKITFSIIAIKLCSVIYLYIIAKSNNYFYQGE